MPRQTLISIHDVSPRHFDRVREIVDMFHELGLGNRFAMLVVPDFWKQWPLEDHPEFCEWLRSQSEAGVEMILHGFTHLDETEHTDAKTAFKAKHMTAGEGEFSGLSHGEAIRKIEHGEQVLRDTCGISADGFCAPAWLYSDAAKQALTDKGYEFAEDHMKVWSPQSGQETAKGPVVSYASRSKSRIASSLLWSWASRLVLAPFAITRIAVHPHDFDIPALKSEIRRQIAHQLRFRAPVYYREVIHPAA